jgi:hypothetical protein
MWPDDVEPPQDLEKVTRTMPLESVIVDHEGMMPYNIISHRRKRYFVTYNHFVSMMIPIFLFMIFTNVSAFLHAETDGAFVIALFMSFLLVVSFIIFICVSMSGAKKHCRSPCANDEY